MYMANFFTLNKRLKECHNDKALLETYFRTTAQKIRAKIQEEQLRQGRMTLAQKERVRQNRLRSARERALFQAAKQKDPKLTLAHHQADLFLQDLAAGKVKFAPQYPEEGGPPVTESESKATSGGRKTRRKRRRKKKKSRRKKKTRRRRKKRKTRKKRR